MSWCARCAVRAWRARCTPRGSPGGRYRRSPRWSARWPRPRPRGSARIPGRSRATFRERKGSVSVLTRTDAVPERETPRGVRLLVADPELGEGIGPQDLEQARRSLVVPLVEGQPGEEASLSARLQTPRPLGMLVLGGLMIRETEVSGAGAAELLGAGDVLVPGNLPVDDLMPGGAEVDWR